MTTIDDIVYKVRDLEVAVERLNRAVLGDQATQTEPVRKELTSIKSELRLINDNIDLVKQDITRIKLGFYATGITAIVLFVLVILLLVLGT